MKSYFNRGFTRMNTDYFGQRGKAKVKRQKYISKCKKAGSVQRIADKGWRAADNGRGVAGSGRGIG